MTVTTVRDLMSVQFTADQVMALLGLDDGTVNPPQAAALLGISPKTIIRRVKSGEIQGYRYGEHSYRIPASEIPAFMAKSAVKDGDGPDRDPGSNQDLAVTKTG
jgi:excisionase family DNA binding protein